MSKANIGEKYYRTIDNEVVQYRLTGTTKYKSEEYYNLTNLKDGTSKSYSQEELLDNFTRLIPDGIICVMSAVYDGMEDVITLFVPYGKAEDDIPFAVCRQNAIDIFYMMENPSSPVTKVGVSINKNIQIVDYKSFFSYQFLRNTCKVYIYMDDTLDDILGLINTKVYDKILKDNCETANTNEKFTLSTGWCSSLKELLEKSEFMMDVHAGFDILEVKFDISKEENQEELVNTIFSATHKQPINVYCCPYDKTIDLKTIKREYILIYSIPLKQIYIVGFDYDKEANRTMSKSDIDNKLKELGFDML